MRLQLTRRSDYAIRGMLELARESGAVVSGAEISRRAQIPRRLVTQVMGDLVHAGLVTARLGRNGGYALAGPATDVSMLSIVEAIEGDSRRRVCVMRNTNCASGTTCSVHHVFADAQEALIERLASATLTSAGSVQT